MIREEVAEHANLYLQFLFDSSHDDLRYHMNQYLFNKMYNTDWGNLVPFVIANVFDFASGEVLNFGLKVRSFPTLRIGVRAYTGSEDCLNVSLKAAINILFICLW